MAAKKFVNDPTNVVKEAVTAFCRTHRNVVRLEGTHVVAKKNINPDQVALICGGGSGHEPAHIGFVADGWLSAAVCGQVFASPPTSAVTAAINYLKDKTKAGILVVVKNYTGDVINFGYAVRIAKAQGVNVSMVVVGDDVTFGVNHDARRGIAGTVLYYNMLGFAAVQGKSLPELETIGAAISKNLRSMGCSLTSCALPGNPISNAFGDEEMEIGLGIHGESGEERLTVQSANDIVERLLANIVTPAKKEGQEVAAAWASCGKRVVLFVNNLGATTDIEMGVVLDAAMKQLAEKFNVSVALVASGRHMTALEMHGFSLSLLCLPDSDEEAAAWMAYLTQVNLPASVTLSLGFVPPLDAPEIVTVANPHSAAAVVEAAQSAANKTETPAGKKMLEVVKKVFTHLATREAHFNALDAKVGDGDTGVGVARAANGALAVIDSLPWATDVPQCFAALGQVVADAFAGTSGPLYGAFLIVGSTELKKLPEDNSLQTFTAAFAKGGAAVSEVGSAKPGERTMFDVINAVTLEIAVASFDVAATPTHFVEVAKTAAENVKQMPATKGRSRYLNGKEIGCCDPGCELVVEWMNIAATAL